MSEQTVKIYGKDGCPFCDRAIDDYNRRGYAVNYLNVKKDTELLNEMLVHSNGQRKVPTIIEDGRVTIGFGGACTV
jgi:glutaredoxin 3